MSILPPALVAKLDPLIRRLASSHDNEVVATVRALDLAETVGQQTPVAPRRESWLLMVGHCLANEEQLRPRRTEVCSEPRQLARRIDGKTTRVADRDLRAADA